MKKTIVIIFILITQFISSQNNWVEFSKENVVSKIINESTSFKKGNLYFDIEWKNKLVKNENLGHLSGIKKLTIYRNKKLISTHVSIVDNVGLGELEILFYDYNFDGYLDFSIRDECGKKCYYKYYLFDKKQQKFVYQKEWDYLKIQKINKSKNLILTQPDGLVDSGELLRVENNKLIKLKRK